MPWHLKATNNCDRPTPPYYAYLSEYFVLIVEFDALKNFTLYMDFHSNLEPVADSFSKLNVLW